VIYVRGKINHLCLKTNALGFPGKIQGILGNTMPPYARTRVKRHKSKRLCSCRLNHFPDIDIELITENSKLID